MKTLVLSNWSQNIAAINEITAPNKQACCDKHGYAFENLEWRYEDHVQWLELVRERLARFDVVMTMGCDTLIMNQAIKIEDKIIKEMRPCHPHYAYTELIEEEEWQDQRVIIAKEHDGCLNGIWPINNDVMIWPKGAFSNRVLETLVCRSKTWLNYPWLWQADLWDLINTPPEKLSGINIAEAIRIIEAREMNSTCRPGLSRFQLGDWIFHALDLQDDRKIKVLRWYAQLAGDGTYAGLPKEITGRR